MPSATQHITISAPPAAVMSLIVDFEAYPSFLPEIESATVLHTEPGAWEVAFTVQVIRQLRYTLRLVQESPTLLRWSLLEGVFRSNDGSWSLAETPDGATEATYAIDVQMGMFVPGNIVHSLVDRGLPQTLARFKEEAERRQGAG